METIELKVYEFQELSDAAKQTAIWYEINRDYFADYLFSDARETLKKFAEIFDISAYQIDFLEPYRNEYKINISSSVLELSGLRLYKYMQNNFFSYLFRPKTYYSKNGKKRKSRIFKINDCVLTGVCYDIDILEPIYNFLNKPSDIDFSELIGDCINSLCSSIEKEYEYMQTEDYMSDYFDANDIRFTADGKVFYW